MKRLALAFLAAAAFTSCNEQEGFTPTPISFVSHPSILRGTWMGTLAQHKAPDQFLRLDLDASYETSRQYGVMGTGKMGADALTVTGSVAGGSLHSYLQAQTSPAPETAQLTIQRSGGNALTLICQSTASAANAEQTPVWLWECSVKDNRAATVVLKKEAP